MPNDKADGPPMRPIDSRRLGEKSTTSIWVERPLVVISVRIREQQSAGDNRRSENRQRSFMFQMHLVCDRTLRITGIEELTLILEPTAPRSPVHPMVIWHCRFGTPFVDTLV